MDRFPIQIKSLSDFESDLHDLGCRVTSRTTLKAYPGCIRWHVKRVETAPGTLELTVEANGQAWLSVHSNRHASWIDEVVRQLT